MRDFIQQHWQAVLAGVAATIATVWGLIWLAIDYYAARFTKVPQLTQKVEKLELDLDAALKARDDVIQSIADTDALRRAIALVPGDIRQITRNVHISYDESATSTITQTIDAQTFQWRVRIKQEENGRYSGFVGHRLWGVPNDLPDTSNDPEQKEMFEAMQKGIQDMGIFINAAERIDLGSREPQLLAHTNPTLSTLESTPDQFYEIYIVIEKNEDESRRWRCALIATESQK